ncbi:multidrug efflux pump subunit AcrB [Limimaricola soesokkakensis]|uniref:Cobalt-zinc-cadmium resistance protein CzcA n=1 Tax=Limimaricola soesokkakensis TaxID=1343159 RepID=A0A1X6Y797_9RHOB|nr:efflux RND transporter permease subunit [Limimaricola soesokkakensis]PSK87318.1 multidrug efflux pump subunit AcrB [Limimaricola soesokkakensis]SLN12058.1 Cobalt-zinc-cadmium resistance protein CzcA [Limimaricola soesokkakensis]
MNIARASIEKPILTWLLILGCLFGGIWGFATLGRLEDPSFTIKAAVISTSYPGASAEQVAREVSEPLESAIQKMGEVDRITSVNRPGVSLIEVEMKSTYDGSALPGIWTKLRARIRDAARDLPPGVNEPLVNDSFGDVFGLYYAVTAPGFEDAEIHRLSTYLRRELLAVEGVADVDLAGLPQEAIFVEPDLALSVAQNLPVQAVLGAISEADSVVPAGTVETGGQRTVIEAPEGSDSVSEISGLSVGVGGEVINLYDVAEVYRGRVEQPSLIVRHDGTEAFTFGVAGLSTENIVEVGKRVDARLATLFAEMPAGVELHPIYQQHEVVEEASNAFLVNLAMSVGIVVAVLALFMGWRAAVVVGVTLLLTVVGTLFFMAIFAIEMERISLGALIIAMGMLVDNAIVVAEGMQIAMLGGQSSRQAAGETAGKTQVPLLGATVIGIMAFAGIGLSPDATGEFMFSLFAVIGISLLLSWVLAITVTPLLGHYFFKRGEAGGAGAYDGALFRAYAATLRGALRARWLVVAALIGITVVCFAGFGQVRQQFFPNSNTPLFFVHYKLPQGSTVQQTASDLAQVEAWLAERDEVVSYTSYAGGGATRFMLTYSAEKSNPSYGHMIIRTNGIEEIPALATALEEFGREALPEGEFRTRRLVFGPGGGDPIEMRVSGPDPEVLREIGDRVIAAMAGASPDILQPRTNWREPELVIRPDYATERAQSAGIDRDDVASVLRFATDGIEGGLYREGERLIPIVVREPRDAETGLRDQPIWSETAQQFLPIEQVIDGLGHEVRDTLVHRRDRVPTLTVGADISPERTAAEVFAQVRAAVEAVEVPPGYALHWGGEFENSADAQESLGKQLPLSLLVMVLISVLLFNAIRQPVIIWLLVPMSVNGVALGLLGSGLPFTFTALLGLLSLSGMLIKNGIVLVEEIDLVRAEGVPLREAIITASVSRLRPVVLAAATTILGMLPLLSDAFFVSMAVTIMGGLAFASVLTLIAAPVFYDLFFSRGEKRTRAAAAAVPA